MGNWFWAQQQKEEEVDKENGNGNQDVNLIQGEKAENGVEVVNDSSVKGSSSSEQTLQPEVEKSTNEREAAAVTLQKVYRSYRTRRNLADCVVVAEELWWQAIEYTTLTQSTESFFGVHKTETAVTRWSRARVKASKVGKGLSKDEKARKLAFQHWLEAIDPRHRYGHNLHFYYDEWFETKTSEPFFYWLDVGDGRNITLEDCPRRTLQKQQIKYLGPKEREQYEVTIQNGKFVHKQTGQLVDTAKGSKWIFVMSPTKTIYLGQKNKGTFQHSSFLAGGAISAAGRLVIKNGLLKSISPYSGHYRPTEVNFNLFIDFLSEKGVDMTNVEKRSSIEEQSLESFSGNQGGLNSKGYIEKQISCEKQGETVVQEEYVDSNDLHAEKKKALELHVDVEKDRMDAESDICFILNNLVYASPRVNNNQHKQLEGRAQSLGTELIEQRTKTEYLEEGQENVYYKRSLSSKELENQITEIPQKALLERLHSKKASKSYQLGKRLSCKWSTGAGPRIGCVADYPSELRFQALQQVNLSPRTASATCLRDQSSGLSIWLASPKAS